MPNLCEIFSMLLKGDVNALVFETPRNFDRQEVLILKNTIPSDAALSHNLIEFSLSICKKIHAIALQLPDIKKRTLDIFIVEKPESAIF